MKRRTFLRMLRIRMRSHKMLRTMRMTMRRMLLQLLRVAKMRMRSIRLLKTVRRLLRTMTMRMFYGMLRTVRMSLLPLRR